MAYCKKCGNNFKVDDTLKIPLFLVVIAMALDFLQYVYSSKLIGNTTDEVKRNDEKLKVSNKLKTM